MRGLNGKRPILVGVVDLRGGQAVHARGGHRDQYLPVAPAVGTSMAPGDARALVDIYTTHFRLEDVYVADLDAIAGRTWQRALISDLAARTPRLWLDAGITTSEQAREAIALGASRVIVGLETLTSYEALDAIVATIGGRTVLSLDTRDGVPITAPGTILPSTPPAVIAKRAADAGAGTIVVLDLARVGLSTGCDLQTLSDVRAAAPGVQLFAGGGVRNEDDLRRLTDAGCDGALVATALLNGTLAPRSW